MLNTCKGTPGYMAPEMMNIAGFNYVTNQNSHKYFSSNGYNGVQTDSFAMGVILFSLMMGRPPFKIADINDPFYRLIFTQQFEEFWKPWDQFAVQNSFELTQDFKDLFVSLVSYCPILRLSMNEILGSKWMKNGKFPVNSDVIEYMTQIKATVAQHELDQKVCFDQTLQSKIEESKQAKHGDGSSDKSLSDCSQIVDDDSLIMSDLQDIEKELYENTDVAGDDSFNIDEHGDIDAESFEFNLHECESYNQPDV